MKKKEILTEFKGYDIIHENFVRGIEARVKLRDYFIGNVQFEIIN